MKNFYALLICLGFFNLFGENASAQNLVPNAGFEIQDSCPAVSEIFVAPPWNSPTTGTPDVFNSTCPTQNGSGRTGIGSSGVYAYSTFPNNREYIQAPLTSTLVGGQAYCVSFYIYRLNFRYAIDRFGAYFSVGAVNLSTTSNLSFTPDVENPAGNFLASNNWILVSGTFTASGGETHIIIGNFSNDASTDTLVANSGSTSKVAYYRIDDISVTACTIGIDDIEDNSDLFSIYPSPASDFVTIQAEKGAGFSGVQMMNFAGQLVKSKVNAFDSPSATLDISDLRNGIYIVSLNTNNGIITKKLVVNH